MTEGSKTELSKADLDALQNLEALAQKAMRSKPALQQLAKLQDRGLIAYDPFSDEVNRTVLGEEKLREHLVRLVKV